MFVLYQRSVLDGAWNDRVLMAHAIISEVAKRPGRVGNPFGWLKFDVSLVDPGLGGLSAPKARARAPIGARACFACEAVTATGHYFCPVCTYVGMSVCLYVHIEKSSKSKMVLTKVVKNFQWSSGEHSDQEQLDLYQGHGQGPPYQGRQIGRCH